MHDEFHRMRRLPPYVFAEVNQAKAVARADGNDIIDLGMGNPTAYLADLDFYREIVAFARRHGIWILSDLAYAEIYFGDLMPPSILQVPGARDIAVEFTSLSKTYSMPGWRMGFAAGNRHLITALTRMKSYLDYGAFTQRLRQALRNIRSFLQTDNSAPADHFEGISA